MVVKWLLILSILPFTVNSEQETPDRPVFSDQYSLKGVVILPYAQLKENFVIYYDGTNKNGRIDYNGGLAQYVTASQEGYELVYTTLNVDEKAEKTCFRSQSGDPTSVIPDLSGFTFSKFASCPTFPTGPVTLSKKARVTCERWILRKKDEKKVNRYSFYLRRDANNVSIPVHYSMVGYDTLLSSHYDKYEIYYKNFKIGPIDENVFKVTENYTCNMINTAIVDPMMEFMNYDHKAIDEEFQQFTRKHGKSYNDSTDLEARKFHFRHNVRFIKANNRRHLPYKLAVNHLADFSDMEVKKMRGLRIDTSGKRKGLQRVRVNASIPDSMDWRLYGAVTPVKDQAICGSCWSFGTTGAVEGHNFIKTGTLDVLSEQQLIDCSWRESNNGCDGGLAEASYDYIHKAGGLASTNTYGHYLGFDGKCHDNKVEKKVKVADYVSIPEGDEAVLKEALAHDGPVAIAIDADLKSFTFYSSGVFYDKDCGNKPEDLDHLVLAVGYGNILGQDYWLVKNSWSTYWGNDGYILINRKDNNCGVASSATYPLIA